MSHEPPAPPPEDRPAAPAPASEPGGGRETGGRRAPLVVGAIVAGTAAAVVGLYLLSAGRTNKVALAQSPRPVSVVKADKATFRPLRSYVATLQPWNSARVGPQFVSAYIDAVLVRPGAAVRRGQVLATLDCRGSSAASRETAARTRAVAERQVASEHEAARIKDLTTGGYASPNEVEQHEARSRSQAAEVVALQASLSTRSLEVSDCVLRAPFAGEVADRTLDPGAYARPGAAIVQVIDRDTVRVVADAPESDFAVVAPGTEVGLEILATAAHLTGRISRRAPAADEQSRTVRFEVDVDNRDHALPVGTTAVLSIEVGDPQPATVIPLRAAVLRGGRATVFVVEGGAAHRGQCAVLGERKGVLFVAPTLVPGSAVVIEGRALLEDGDLVSARELAP